jgi:putative transposase
MARPLRIQAPGLTYHVTARGTGRLTIYRDDRDRRTFLRLLAAIVAPYRLHCLAYCLMDTHYHLVATTLDANLSRAIKHLNGTYAQWWNHRHERPGHVFQGRFCSQVIEDDLYLLAACRYVVLNPVRAGVVRKPADWRWSSYRATAGMVRAPLFLRPEALWRQLGTKTLRAAIHRYRAFVTSDARGEAPLPARPVLGSHAFLQQFSEWREQASGEVPQRERRVRPSLEALFHAAATRTTRDRQVVEAFASGYTMAEISRFLQLHPSTISRILNVVGEVPGREKCVDSRPDPPPPSSRTMW